MGYVFKKHDSCLVTTLSRNLMRGKSPPNELRCPLLVSYAVYALIFLAFALFKPNPSGLRYFRKLVFVDSTIWVPPAFFGLSW
jgi:hypothetical protein